jgi:hypothetical protein
MRFWQTIKQARWPLRIIYFVLAVCLVFGLVAMLARVEFGQYAEDRVVDLAEDLSTIVGIVVIPIIFIGLILVPLYRHHLRWKKTINTDGEFVMAQSAQQPQQSPYELYKKFPLVHHHEVQETFVDQLGLFTFDGGTLRMELAVTQMNEPKPPAQPTGERHIVARLVMSAPCAIDLIKQMQLIAAQLAQAGLIKMERPPPPVQPTAKAN